jgi:hypothetical protein
LTSPRELQWDSADADFHYWSKVGLWSLDESVALLLGKSPEGVSWKSVQAFVAVSDFAREYERVRGLAQDSVAMRGGRAPVQPSEVLAWAVATGIEVPAGLLAAAEARRLRKLKIAGARPVRKADAGHPPVVVLTREIPVLTAVVDATVPQRRDRLRRRRDELRKQGVRDFAKRLAAEEGVSPKRLRTLLKGPKRSSPK